jgi:hypothetical protein
MSKAERLRRTKNHVHQMNNIMQAVLGYVELGEFENAVLQATRAKTELKELCVALRDFISKRGDSGEVVSPFVKKKK